MSNIVIAAFERNSKYCRVYDALWQWDYGQVLRIQGLNLPSAVEIHFAFAEDETSITRIGVTKDGVTDVILPDSILEKETNVNYQTYAYVYLTDDESGQTEYKIILNVKARPKPEGRTGDETSTMAAILKAVNEIANSKKLTDEQVSAVLNGYLKDHPIEENDPTVPEWAKAPTKPSYTAEEVGALPVSTKIPASFSDLQDDNDHRTVTDAEKENWNSKIDQTALDQAVETSLQQAKESGEFKGDKGDPGEQGLQGIQGVDGKDGENGKDGAKGVDGVSVISVSIKEVQ